MLVQCEICPRRCIIAPGQSGECRIRMNLDGRLTAVTYGYPCSVHVDPVEKKPIFHFLPGTQTFSIATVGCNLHCKNCQNWEISQQNPEDSEAFELPPDRIPALSRDSGCRSVSFTYTDPVVYYEYTRDTYALVRQAGLRTVLVTAGYINRDPFRELLRHVDGIRIDLKAMSDEFYRDICDATLSPVLDSLVLAKEMCAVVEVVHLVIPTLNDRDEDLTALCRWVAGNLGKETPIHFSRFFPKHRLLNLPPTPAATLHRARDIARAEGLHFVYTGNMAEEDSAVTTCPSCGLSLIERRGYSVIRNVLRDGKCPACATAIYGVWS